MAACKALDRGRFVRRVVVDVEVRVRLKAVHDEVDECLEGAALPVRRYGTGFDRPERVTRRLTGSVHPPRFDHAEEVFDPVDFVRTEERVALDVEEQVARRGLREHQQPLVRHEGSVAVARGRDALGDHHPGPFPAHLDFGLRADPPQGLPPGAVEPLRQRLGGFGEPGPRCDPHSVQRVALPGRQARDEGEIVVRTPLVTAPEAPPADVAVLDGLGDRLHRIGGGPVQRRLELARHEPVVGCVVRYAERDLLSLHTAEGEVHLLGQLGPEARPPCPSTCRSVGRPMPSHNGRASCPRPHKPTGRGRWPARPALGSRRTPGADRRTTRPGR